MQCYNPKPTTQSATVTVTKVAVGFIVDLLAAKYILYIYIHVLDGERLDLA